MKQALGLMLEDDTIDHIDWIKRHMAKQRNKTVTRSEVVEWLVIQHWKKIRVSQNITAPTIRPRDAMR